MNKYIIVVIALMLYVFLFVHHNGKQETETLVTFLDIGQGDATFIAFSDSTQMLIDCAIDARILEALSRVMSFSDRSIDYLVITHPDRDHIGGCIDVLRRFDVEHIVYTDYVKDGDDMWTALLDVIDQELAQYHVIEQYEEWEIGDIDVRFLYPDHNVGLDPRVPGESAQGEANDTSIIMLLSHAAGTVLLTGDGEEKLERYLIETYGDELDVDVLKAGHHGSKTSSIQEFIDITSPEHAVISSGADNHFGHPSLRVLSRFDRASTTVWRTDEHGDITIKFGENMQIYAQ